MKSKIFIISSLALLGLSTAAFTNIQKVEDNKQVEETTEGVVWNGEIPYAVCKPYVYSSNPTDEHYYLNQGISLNHLGDINSVWNSYRGDGVKIAIIDNSGSYHHEDFWTGSECHVSNKSANFYTVVENGYITDIVREDVGEDFSNESVLNPRAPQSSSDCVYHGISVGATAGASISGNGTVGIAPNSEVVFLKTDMLSSSICKAIEYAANIGCDVINMSLGSQSDDSYLIEYWQSYIDYAYNKGVIVVASAGNENSSLRSLPAALNHVVGVGALARDSSSQRADYSNYNSSETGPFNVDVTAPGTVYTAKDYSYGTSTYTEINGTSFSSPIVAGAAALFKQKYPGCNQDTFENKLFSSCTDIGASGWDTTFGNGALNVARLLEDDAPVIANPTTTKNQDSTNIVWQDQIGWNFRTLHIYSLGFFNGYTAKDFENYMTIEYGAKIDRASYSMEGTTAGWACNVENNINDYLLNTGVSTSGSNVTYTVHLPWWVTNAIYQFVNNSNWIRDDGAYVFDGDTHYKHEIKSYIYGDAQVSTPTPSVATTYDFKAIFVTRVIYKNDTSTIYATLDNYKACIYDKLNAPAKYTVDGYGSSCWYSDADLTTEYTTRIVREDITLYLMISSLDATVYYQKTNDTPLYLYEAFIDAETCAVIEPLGSFPGTLLREATGVNFNGYGLYKGVFHMLSTVNDGLDELVISDGNRSNALDISIILDEEIEYVYFNTETNSYSANASYGTAADLIYDLNALRYTVSANGSIFTYSYCGVTREQARYIVTRYSNLNSTAKAIFDAASIYTYKTDNSVDYANVSTMEIMLLMNKIASDTGTGAHSVTLFNDNTCAVIIALVSITALFIGLATIKFYRNKESSIR